MKRPRKTPAIPLQTRFSRLLTAAALLACPASAAPVHSPTELAFSPDGRHLAVADPTASALFLIDAPQALARPPIALQGQPEGLAWSADSSRLFVAETGAFHIAEINPANGEITRRIPTGRYPAGLALSTPRQLLLACDRGRDLLQVIDLTSGKTLASLPTGRQPTQVALCPQGRLAAVSNLLPATPATDPQHASEVTLVDLETLKATASIRLPAGSTNPRHLTIHPDGKTAFVAHTLGRFQLPTTQLDRGWVNTNAISVLDLPSASLRATVLLDLPTDGAADPWGLAISPGGDFLHITLAGTHQLARIDLAKLEKLIASHPKPETLANDLAALHRAGILHRADLPVKGPRGLAGSPDGATLAIAGTFSSQVLLHSPTENSTRNIPIGPPATPDAARRGEIAFHDASLCFQRWLSCVSCHPSARADGLNWDLLNDGVGNPKNARSMLLSHATPPVMSLGVRADMDTAIRAGFIHIQFTQPTPETLADVSAYLRSLEPAPSPYLLPDGSLTESALRGKALFHNPAVGCAQCHPAPLFTDLALTDVGTATSRDAENATFDTPTLLELWRTPPYLHDGRSATLRQVLVEHNPDDLHGTTSHLSPAEIDDLEAYLLSL